MIKIVMVSILGLLVGGGIGYGGGLFFLPPAAPDIGGAAAPIVSETEDVETAFADFSEQFIIPLITRDNIEALMVLTISIEVDAANLQAVYDQEPKLRAAFLQSLFNHANNGGFSGNYTLFSPMQSLRRELRQIATNEIGDVVHDVLILDAIRQN